MTAPKRARKPPTTDALPVQRLGLRRPPAQDRGIVTFDRVLATASRLLAEVGAEGLTTNLIATESQVNISSIYKYFPNKQAVLVALFERHNQQRIDAARLVIEELATAKDWRAVIDKAVDKILQSRRSTRGGVALRRAMRSSPELADIDQRANAAVAQWFAGHVAQLTGLGASRALVVARVIVEAEVALLDWWESPEVAHQAAVAREVKALLKAYLGLYVEPGHSGSA